MDLAPTTPLGDRVERIPLPGAPIARVVAQVRFPPILSIADEEFVAPFQERLRKQYPGYTRELQQNIVLNEGGVLTSKPAVTHRFTDAEGVYQVSLAQSFVALDRQGYDNREDFIDRLGNMVETTAEVFEPSVYERFGIRYTDRIHGEALDRLTDLVRPELLGMLGLSALGDGEVTRSLSEVEFNTPEGFLKARWGLLPAGNTVNQSVPPLEVPSWVLDLDAFVMQAEAYEPEQLRARAWYLTDVIYRFFRWSVQDEFLAYYGASV